MLLSSHPLSTPFILLHTCNFRGKAVLLLTIHTIISIVTITGTPSTPAVLIFIYRIHTGFINHTCNVHTCSVLRYTDPLRPIQLSM